MGLRLANALSSSSSSAQMLCCPLEIAGYDLEIAEGPELSASSAKTDPRLSPR